MTGTKKVKVPSSVEKVRFSSLRSWRKVEFKKGPVISRFADLKGGIDMATTRWQSGMRGGADLDRLRADVEQLFNSITGEEEPFFSRVYPALNLSEDADRYYVRAELPGVKPESLDISVVEGRLLIRGERKESPEEREVYYHRKERESGFFRRSLNLPGKVAPDKVSAHLKNGVLTVVLPKPEEAKPRKIAVQTT